MTFWRLWNLNLINTVSNATSRGGHIIDLVFLDKDNDLIHEVYVDEVCCISPIHKLVSLKISLCIEPRKSKTIQYR